jgi:hypothetical protein
MNRIALSVSLASVHFRLLLVLVAGAVVLAPGALAQDGREAWADLPATAEAFARADDAPDTPRRYRALAVDPEALGAHLARAPRERTPGDFTEALTLAIPLPDGGFGTYRVVESPAMAPGLQARFPSIRTYVGVGVEDPGTTLRLSLTPHGVHAVGRHASGVLLLDPLAPRDRQRVRAYWRHDARRPADHAAHRADHAVVYDEGGLAALAEALATDRPPRHQVEQAGRLRVYRAAIAATGEYTAFHSGEGQPPSVERGLAAIVTTLHRVNEIYERDLAIRFVLVEENDAIVYTDPTTDPYSNNDGSAMLNQNQTNLDAVIGPDGYDIGHVFSTGGGGLAGVSVVCRSGVKARGVTGLPAPAGDLFDVDYVSHEVGHQFGAAHTFNGSAGGCSGGNRIGASAFEPGSGSTIMAYAGICGAHNIQSGSDAYFHNRSMATILSYVNAGAGSTCGEVVATGREAPALSVREGVSIPALTPFTLRGEATTSGPSEALTFTWEGLDLGSASPPPTVEGWVDTAPFFRSFAPSRSPVRHFPRPDLLTLGLPTLGEGLPVTTRTLTFRFTVRDNAPGGGAVRDREVRVPVVAEAGPFRVTSQAEGDVVWQGGSVEVVTWDVANTASAAFGAETVDVLLSLDRETGFVEDTALVLAAAVPNIGAAAVTVPDGYAAARARVFVRASEGLFFAVNARDIALMPRATSAESAPVVRAATLSAAYPNPLGPGGARATLYLTLPEGRGQAVRVAVYDALGREVAVAHEGPVPGGAPLPVSVEASGLAAGVYYVRAVGEGFSLVRPLTVAR